MIEPSPDNTEPIAPASLLRFAEFAVAPAWVGSIPILASEAVSESTTCWAFAAFWDSSASSWPAEASRNAASRTTVP
jgi:hypothetical protein